MPGFWEKYGGGSKTAAPAVQSPYAAPAATPAPGQASWWQAPVAQQVGPRLSEYVPGRDGPTLEELARKPASSLSSEALELVAQWKLAKNAKYDNQCPNCYAENGYMRAKASTALRCVECGYSSRGIHDETGLQPISKISRGNSIPARNFTGGNMGDKGFQHASQTPYGNIDSSIPGV